MSDTLKINIKFMSGIIALVITLGGGIWAVATRATDLDRLQVDHAKLELKLEGELLKVKTDLQSFRDLAYEMRTDIKWLRTQQEQLAKK
jgi:hypothetical protein